MNDLTTLEEKIFNNMSREHDPGVFLGNVIQALIGAQPEIGTPVNAVAAAILEVTGAVIDGETVTIANPAVAGQNVYEFVTDAAKTKPAPANISVDIKAKTTASTGTLTMAAQPTAGDTVTIGDRTYIFVPAGTANAVGEVSIGTNLSGAQAALVAAINGTDSINTPHPLVRAGAFAANASVINALWGGTVGDTIATTETFTSESNLFAATTLGSGADCTAANAIVALVSAITASDTQGVSAADGTGDTVVLTAETAGVAGNEIAVSTGMANAAFAEEAVSLTGGVDGTVSDGVKILVDETYLYVCLEPNTVADANWRRISVGTVY